MGWRGGEGIGEARREQQIVGGEGWRGEGERQRRGEGMGGKGERRERIMEEEGKGILWAHTGAVWCTVLTIFYCTTIVSLH